MPQQLEARVYDRLAKAHAFLDRMFARAVLATGIRQGAVLDVGCGSGLLAIRLAQAAPGLKVTALDLSPEMLRIGEENAREAGVRGIRFVQGDATALQFPDERFDLVISQHTAHHLAGADQMVRQMQRIVKRGGVLLLRDLRRPRTACGIAVLVFIARGTIYRRLGAEAALGAELYRASLRAALNRGEWRALAARCGISADCISNLRLLNHQDIRWTKPGA